MKTFRALLFFLFFQAEIHVRASNGVLQTPESCLKSKSSCAFYVANQSYRYVGEGAIIHSAKGTTIVRESDKKWNFVSGSIWVQESENLNFETVYASVWSGVGQFWIVGEKDRIIFRNISSDLKITLRDGQSLNLPEGFEIWISGLNSKGKSEYGVLRPIDMKSHVSLWGSMYKGDKKSFRKELLQLKGRWGQLPEKSAQIYRGMVDRDIAATKEIEKEKARDLAQKRADRQKVRELYYQRVFER